MDTEFKINNYTQIIDYIEKPTKINSIKINKSIIIDVIYINNIRETSFTKEVGIKNGCYFIYGYNYTINPAKFYAGIYDPQIKSLKNISNIFPKIFNSTNFMQCISFSSKGILITLPGLNYKGIVTFLDFETGVFEELSDKIPQTEVSFLNICIDDVYYIQGWKKEVGWGTGYPVFWSFNPYTLQIRNLTNYFPNYGINTTMRVNSYAIYNQSLLCAYGAGDKFSLIEYNVKSLESTILTDKITPLFDEKENEITTITWIGSEFILVPRYSRIIKYNPTTKQFFSISNSAHLASFSDSAVVDERAYFVGGEPILDHWEKGTIPTGPNNPVIICYYQKLNTLVKLTNLTIPFVDSGFNQIDLISKSDESLLFIARSTWNKSPDSGILEYPLTILPYYLNVEPKISISGIGSESGWYSPDTKITVKANYIINNLSDPMITEQLILDSYSIDGVAYKIEKEYDIFKIPILMDNNHNVIFNYKKIQTQQTNYFVYPLIGGFLILIFIILYIIRNRAPR